MQKPMRIKQQKRDRVKSFHCLKVYIPFALERELRKISKERKIPMSRLAAIALDNELDCGNAFNYSCELPKSSFVEYAFLDEAARMLRYIENNFPQGASRDILMFCRREMRIPDKETFMHAYRELLEYGRIEEIRPEKSKFEFAEDYKITRVVKEKDDE